MNSDRIPCINPRCCRTAPAEKCEPSTEIICGKCLRSLPLDWRRRDRELRRRRRFVVRRWHKRISCGDIAPESPAPLDVIDRALCELWDQAKAYFTTPEKPANLSSFLQEIGL